MATSKSKKKYVIARATAGVFAGTLESHKAKEVVLSNARRLWFWDGAFTLSQLAMEGTSKPNTCKFPIAVSLVTLTETIEILDTTIKAQNSIESVRIWR